jgi:DNA-damage-inducible protein J
MLVQVVTRVEEEEKKIFDTITHDLGITPAEALRIFIKAFDKASGFPFELKVQQNYTKVPNINKIKKSRMVLDKNNTLRTDKKFLDKFAQAWEM